MARNNIFFFKIIVLFSISKFYEILTTYYKIYIVWSYCLFSWFFAFACIKSFCRYSQYNNSLSFKFLNNLTYIYTIFLYSNFNFCLFYYYKKRI